MTMMKRGMMEKIMGMEKLEVQIYLHYLDLRTNGVVITDAIKFIQTNKEKLTMSNKNQDDKECRGPDYGDKDKDQLEEKQEEETGEQRTSNQVFDSRLNLYDSSYLGHHLISMIWTF